MESTTSTMFRSDLSVVDCRTTPGQIVAKGTGLSVAARNRTAVAPMAAIRMAGTTASALLPISDVVFNGLVGIRSWSPPV